MDCLHMDVLKKLEEKIKELPIGAKLPSEREMVQTYGVSRNVLREALVLLSDRGLIEIKPGKGSYVAKKDNTKFEQYLEEILKEDDANGRLQVLEVREGLELSMFEKAVMNANQKDIEELEEIYREMDAAVDQSEHYSELDLKLHLKIAEATHNEIFPKLVMTLYGLSGEKILLMEDLFPKSIQSFHKDHRGIIEAIKARDSEAVRAVGKEHFDIAKYLLQSMEK